jgi:hypothetical protein
LKRASADDDVLYDPERPSLTPRVGATLSAAYVAVRRARAFDCAFNCSSPRSRWG